MDEGGKQNKNNYKRESSKHPLLQRHSSDASSLLQSVWVRCRTIFPNITDRKFMEGELRFVLYSGILFWSLYLFYEIIKTN